MLEKVKTKIRNWLYPSSEPVLPKAPAHFKEVMQNKICISLNLRGKIAVLFSGNIEVVCVVVLEKPAGDKVAESTSSVVPPKWLRQPEVWLLPKGKL